MNLHMFFFQSLAWQVRVGTKSKLVRAYHCPSLDAVFDHEVLCHGGRDLRHVMPVLLLAEVWSAVAENCQTKELAVCIARRTLRNLTGRRHWRSCRW
jgi:hypothetical protein